MLRVGMLKIPNSVFNKQSKNHFKLVYSADQYKNSEQEETELTEETSAFEEIFNDIGGIITKIEWAILGISIAYLIFSLIRWRMGW